MKQVFKGLHYLHERYIVHRYASSSYSQMIPGRVGC